MEIHSMVGPGYPLAWRTLTTSMTLVALLKLSRLWIGESTLEVKGGEPGDGMCSWAGVIYAVPFPVLHPQNGIKGTLLLMSKLDPR